MRVLVTGATGFIGSHVVRRFLTEGHEVHALIRPNSRTTRLDGIIESLGIISGDLFSADELHRRLKQVRPELCIHLAWCVEPGKYIDSLDNLKFVSGSIELANILANLGCKRFVGVGTCFEYDTHLGYLSENTPTLPGSLYAASKLGLFLILHQLSRLTGMEVAWARIFYLYGPCEDERRLVPSVICSLLSNREAKITRGEQIRDFMHIEDVGGAICAVALSTISGPVNIGSGRPVMVRDIVKKIGRILGKSELIALGAVPYTVSDPMFICADNRLLTENTGWCPRYDLDEGLSRTVEWWKSRQKYI